MRVLFTETSRDGACQILSAMSWTVVFLTIAQFGFALYLNVSLSKFTTILGSYDGYLLPVFHVISGTVVGFVYFFLALTFLKASKKRDGHDLYEKHFKSMILGQIFAVALQLPCVILVFLEYQHLYDSFNLGLKTAIQHYSEDAVIKLEIDHLQTTFRCCGNEGYKDWLDIKLNQSVNSVPFSCCYSRSLRPCIRDDVMNTSRHVSYDPNSDLTLFRVGCRDKVSQYYKDNALVWSEGISTSILCLQIFILVMSRLLQTSMLAAIELGDPALSTYGYIINCRGGSSQESDDTIPLTTHLSGIPSERQNEDIATGSDIIYSLPGSNQGRHSRNSYISI